MTNYYIVALRDSYQLRTSSRSIVLCLNSHMHKKLRIVISIVLTTLKRPNPKPNPYFKVVDSYIAGTGPRVSVTARPFALFIVWYGVRVSVGIV
eukprot:g77825.t1